MQADGGPAGGNRREALPTDLSAGELADAGMIVGQQPRRKPAVDHNNHRFRRDSAEPATICRRSNEAGILESLQDRFGFVLDVDLFGDAVEICLVVAGLGKFLTVHQVHQDVHIPFVDA